MSLAMVATPPPSEESLEGPKVLLIGPGGNGKTRSLGTLADWCAKHQKKMIVLFIEKSRDVFFGYWRDRGLPIPPGIYTHTVSKPPLSLKDLQTGATKTGQLSFQALTQSIDPDRSKRNPVETILNALADLKDDRTGEKLGNIDQMGADWAFALDSMTELSDAYMKMVIGNRPTASQSDYLVAQNNLMNLLRYLTQGLKCTVAVTAHVDREMNALTQTTIITVKAIGKAIATEIPPLFSDVVYCQREGSKFSWSNTTFGVDTKARYLPYEKELEPDFAQIMNLWLKRGGA